MSCPLCGGHVQRLTGEDVTILALVATTTGHVDHVRVPAVIYACTACEWAESRASVRGEVTQ
jgi:hypothetical protein